MDCGIGRDRPRLAEVRFFATLLSEPSYLVPAEDVHAVLWRLGKARPRVDSDHHQRSQLFKQMYDVSMPQVADTPRDPVVQTDQWRKGICFSGRWHFKPDPRSSIHCCECASLEK